MLTRVVTFSIILIIDRSRTPGSLQPLGSFLFTGVAVKELTSPTSLRHWICQKHSHYGAEADLGGGCKGCALPPPTYEMTCGFLIQLVFCKKKKKLCGLLVLK